MLCLIYSILVVSFRDHVGSAAPEMLANLKILLYAETFVLIS